MSIESKEILGRWVASFSANFSRITILFSIRADSMSHDSNHNYIGIGQKNHFRKILIMLSARIDPWPTALWPIFRILWSRGRVARPIFRSMLTIPTTRIADGFIKPDARPIFWYWQIFDGFIDPYQLISYFISGNTGLVIFTVFLAIFTLCCTCYICRV